MIVYHKNNEIDREQWDNCIRNSPGAKPYAYSWYLDIMAPGWQALVDDEYDSVFPIPQFSRFGIQYIVTPVFLQQLGAFSPDKPVNTAVNEFFEFLPDAFRFTDLNIGQKLEAPGYKLTEHINYELDISRSYELLSGKFSELCHKNLKSAEKKRPDLVCDISPEELIDLYLNTSKNEFKNIRSRDIVRLRNLINFCVKNRKGRILGVRESRKRLVFAVFIVEVHGRKTILLAVNTSKGKERNLDYFVVNELIRNHSQSRTVLDYAGSYDTDMGRLMESFGSCAAPYYRVLRNRLIWPLRLLKQ